MSRPPRPTPPSTSRRCCSARRSSSRGGTSSDAPGDRGGGGDVPRGRGCAARRAGPPLPRAVRRPPGAALRPLRRDGEAPRPRVRRRGGRPLLDPHAPALRPRTAVAAGAHTHVLAAVSAPRPDDNARSVFHDRLPLRCDLSRGAIPGRTGAAGPRDRAAEEGPDRPAGEVAVHAGPRVRLLLAPAGLSRRRRVVSPRCRGARRTLVDGAARGGDAGRRRAPRRVAIALAADREIRGAVAARFRGAAAAAARRHGCHRRHRRPPPRLPAHASQRARHLGPPPRRRLPARRAPRSDRRALRDHARRARHGVARVTAVAPARPGTQPGAVMPLAFEAVAVAAFGLVVGSFLNGCIYRLARTPSVVWPASRCAECARPLAWYENIPVLSYTALRGRCQTCGVRISIRYPIVEAITMAVYLWHWYVWGLQPILLPKLLFASALIVLFAIDLEHQILPNVITLPGIVIGFVCSLVWAPGPLASLEGIALGGGILWLIAEVWLRLRGVEAMGFGDVKMLAMVGAF